MRSRLFRLAQAAALGSIAMLPLLGAAACSDSGSTAAPDAALSAECMEAAAHADLAFVQDKILTPGCAAFSSCHRGLALMAGGLNLESGMARGAMVNKASRIDPSKLLIKPGDPANSYLMIITGKYTGVIDPMVGTMPSRNPLLCAGKLDAMDRWIAAGAL
jgi:hypothetical protein